MKGGRDDRGVRLRLTNRVEVVEAALEGNVAAIRFLAAGEERFPAGEDVALIHRLLVDLQKLHLRGGARKIQPPRLGR